MKFDLKRENVNGIRRFARRPNRKREKRKGLIVSKLYRTVGF
jgi:hypothetical protein